MFRIASSFLTVCLFLWVLPLGAFIKPGQEETACGGKRAFHMCCSMGMGKVNPNPSSKVTFTNASDFGHGAKSSASAGDDAVLESSAGNLFLNRSVYREFILNLPDQRIPCPVFHPPQNIALF